MKFSSKFKVQDLNGAQLVLHHAVQFIAASGRYLLPEQEDDSHTNMRWDPKTGTFYGGSINNRARVGLHVSTLSLKVSGPTGIELASFPLIGKTKLDGLTWLRQALQLKQIDTSDLKLDMHYEIPKLLNGSKEAFPSIETSLLKELSNHRSISDQICSDIYAKYSKATAPRSWPHHFDHGIYVPFAFDKNSNAIKSFSLGYAVADSIIKEPYFYITQWKKDVQVDYSNAPELEYGEWLPKKLNGAALGLNAILKMTDQEIGIQRFLEDTIEFSTTI